jgi:hypothetical protein
VPGKDFGRAAQVRKDRPQLCGGVFPERPSNTKQGRVRKRNRNIQDMFTGTMIEDLIATVERAEAKAQGLAMTEIEPWFASVQENANHDSKCYGVA